MKFEDRLAQGVPIRLVILGGRGVGKSALAVRFLTKRFIGEYRSNTDMLYKCSVMIDGAAQPVEIMDTSSATDNYTEAHLQWADAFILAYSITDKNSFTSVNHILDIMSVQRPSTPTLILGTKLDLSHSREVDEIDGRCLALNHSCRFQELSSAEGYTSVVGSFDSFLREVKSSHKFGYKTSSSGGDNHSPRQRKISVSRMLGSLIGRSSPPPSPISQLIVLDRSELSKSKAPIRHL